MDNIYPDNPSPSSAPAASPEDDDPFTVIDAQGMAHRGTILIRTAWAPEMGRLDESVGEEFRIVVLREPPAHQPAPECGVVVCAPDGAARPAARVRETATSYRTRPSERHGEPAIALAPEHAAALARGLQRRWRSSVRWQG